MLHVMTPIQLLKPWPNILASQRKFAKPEPVYELAKGGQTETQVSAQAHASHKRPSVPRT